MLSMTIKGMVSGEVTTEVGTYYISEVAVSAFQEEVCINGECSVVKDQLYYRYDKHRDLYVSVVIDEDGGDTGYFVSDTSIYDAFSGFLGEVELEIFESYDNPLDYRNSVYEAFFTIASNNAEALSRAYHSHVGTFDDLEEDMEYGA